MDVTSGGTSLIGLRRINVILGKNGCGKSTLLKQVEADLTTRPNEIGLTKYITPERGGVLVYEASIEQNVTANKAWMRDTRRSNQFYQFRQQTVAQYRMLETTVLRRVEGSVKANNPTHPPGFDVFITTINSLLDNIEIRRDEGPAFKIFQKSTGQALEPAAISSGESELISLAIECLTFGQEASEGIENVLFLDEPDVHLHPDLQARFVHFLMDLVESSHFRIVIATHSTALLGELSDYEHAALSLMKVGDLQLEFHEINDTYKRILPVFGAHPLSNVFNQAPVLLLEGEDDERIWQQAARSSSGKVRVYPVACNGIGSMSEYEQQVSRIVSAVYDNAKAYSLRDRDETEGEIDDIPPVVRMRLACRSAENLILTEEVLEFAGTDWPGVISRIDSWVASIGGHPKLEDMVAFKEGGYLRKTANLKSIRMLLVGEMLATAKPWEVLVGQVIGRLSHDDKHVETSNPDSIVSYLGEKVVFNLLT